MLKKIAVSLVVWIILSTILVYPCFVTLDAISEPTVEYLTTHETQPKVYTTNYGEKYHNETCHYLHSSKNARGLDEAKSKGYSACSYCHGIPNGTIEVERVTRTEIPPKPTSMSDAVLCSVGVSFIPTILVFIYINRRYPQSKLASL